MKTGHARKIFTANSYTELHGNLTKTVVADTTGWRTKCHTIDCTHNTLLLQKHLTSGAELILIGWKIVPNESL